jgi:putative serine protease PepD
MEQHRWDHASPLAPTLPTAPARPPSGPLPTGAAGWGPPVAPRVAAVVEPTPPQPPRPRRVAVATALAALALVAGAVGGFVATDDDTTTTAVTTGAELVSYPAASDVASVVAAATGSVVRISATSSARPGASASAGLVAGTGVVLDDEGHIITNAHVVADTTDVTVVLDGEANARAATVVAVDASADIAVLQVADTTGLVPATFAAADELAVGDVVVAIGDALDLEGDLSVTQGIVSALDRSIETTEGTLDGLIQTDAAISSGNSGGALLDDSGRVVGITTAVATSSGTTTASGIGFAIPADEALAVARDLLA